MKFEIKESVVVNGVNVREILVDGVHYITTGKLAEIYGTTNRRITENFNRNKKQFEEGKHFLKLVGNDLQDLKDAANHKTLTKSMCSTDTQNAYRSENGQSFDKGTSNSFLWSERGALNHAKMLNTDEAWNHFDLLVEFYFDNRNEQNDTANIFDMDALKKIIGESVRAAVKPIQDHNESLNKTIVMKAEQEFPWTDCIVRHAGKKKPASEHIDLLMADFIKNGYVIRHTHPGTHKLKEYEITEKGRGVFGYYNKKRTGLHANPMIFNIVSFSLRQLLDYRLVTNFKAEIAA
ncbi:ORF6N domain-containing protein [Atlantibacter hermannii]|uniref:ORF6N domain-containing protein n=1 Tax=Atlantibacter hermannii TaxID=565 RepID=UPI0028A9E3E1|nr:ORF6N domain-containing protein [Atlantibacter hermannii]